MVDLISQEYDIVARYQGGNNAGHTVKNERGIDYPFARTISFSVAATF